MIFSLWLVLAATVASSTKAQTVPETTVSSSSVRSTTRTRTVSSSAATGTNTANFSISYSVNGTSSIPITVSAAASSTSSVLTPTMTVTTQYPSLSDVPECVNQCLQESVAAANCTTIIEVSCFCGKEAFSNSITQCVARDCYDQVGNSETLAQQFCNIASVSLTFPPATSPTSTSASTAISASGSSSTSTVASNHAGHKYSRIPVDLGWTTLAGIACMILS